MYSNQLARTGLLLMRRMFGAGWAEEQRLRGEREADLTMGGLLMVGITFWFLCAMSICMDYTNEIALVYPVFFGFPIILICVSIRTRRQVQKRKEARERAKREATDHNDTQPPM